MYLVLKKGGLKKKAISCYTQFSPKMSVFKALKAKESLNECQCKTPTYEFVSMMPFQHVRLAGHST